MEKSIACFQVDTVRRVCAHSPTTCPPPPPPSVKTPLAWSTTCGSCPRTLTASPGVAMTSLCASVPGTWWAGGVVQGPRLCSQVLAPVPSFYPHPHACSLSGVFTSDDKFTGGVWTAYAAGVPNTTISTMHIPQEDSVRCGGLLLVCPLCCCTGLGGECGHHLTLVPLSLSTWPAMSAVGVVCIFGGAALGAWDV